MSDTPKAPPQRRGMEKNRHLRRRSATMAIAGAVSLALFAPHGAGMAVAAPAMAAVDPNRPWMDPALSADERATLLLSEMTLEEKVDLMTGDGFPPEEGAGGYFNAAIPRLGIPALRMADAGSGIRLPIGASETTAMPGLLALAASWSPELAGGYAAVVGEEAFAVRHNVVLGPNGDLARLPWWGRTGETMGEDPHLASEILRPMPEALQRDGVIGSLKHVLLNNQETDRGNAQDSVADERTIQELYVRPYYAAVEGDIGSMMCAFNAVNGVPACGNHTILTEIMREQLGFKGFYMSDYLAVRSTDSVNAGMDMEMPGGGIEPQRYGQLLVNAVNSGAISVDAVNASVLRILRTMFVHGLFDTLVPDAPLPIPEEEHSTMARTVDEKAITLLKNEDNALPLAGGEIDSIAVIGSDADRPARLGASPYIPTPTRSVGLVEGLQNYAPDNVDVQFERGLDPLVAGANMFTGPAVVPGSVLSVPGSPDERGAYAEFYETIDQSGDPALVRTEEDISVNHLHSIFPLFDSARTPAPATTQSLRFTSVLTVPVTGEYTFALSGVGDATLWFDDVEITHLVSDRKMGTAQTGPITLTAGEQHSIRVEHHITGVRNGFEPGAVQLQWTHPDNLITPDQQRAVDLASESDVAVVFARTMESETQDSASLTLPAEQDQLISAVAAANPNTIVVLGTGIPVTMPWADEVAAVVQSYYGGQEQGNAIARVLLGEVNPSGKLPYTMPVDESQPEALGLRNPVENEGSLTVPYDEGVFIGYRGYDRLDLDPQYPFGHGLSYTDFGYADLKTAPNEVSFELSNVGVAAGTEVAQVYVGQLPTDAVETPERALAGFARVDVPVNGSTTVTVPLDPKSLSYWDVETDQWVMPSGEVDIFVGTSSRDIKLTGSVQIGAPIEPSFDGVKGIIDQLEAEGALSEGVADRIRKSVDQAEKLATGPAGSRAVIAQLENAARSASGNPALVEALTELADTYR